MNCREFETALVLRLLEALPPEALAEIDGHRAVCRRCAARFEKAGRLPVFVPGEAGPAPSEPSASWPAVLKRLEQSRVRRPRPLRSKLVWAVAGAAGVFLAGLVIGRGVIRPGGSGPVPVDAGPASVLRAYVERLDPLLVGFQIERDGPPPAEIVAFEKRMTAELRRETALLKEAARLAGQSAVVDILDEIDNLLVGLAYLPSGGRDETDQMRRVIRENREAWEWRLLAHAKAL